MPWTANPVVAVHNAVRAWTAAVAAPAARSHQLYWRQLTDGDVGAALSGDLTGALGRPVFDVIAVFGLPGGWSYVIPEWVIAGDLIDLVLIGGGASGENASIFGAGKGGKSAQFVHQTDLVVGTDVPVGSVLSGTVGSPGGSGNNNSGNATNCTQRGLSSAGGSGAVSSGIDGGTPTPLSLNGVLYETGGEGGRGAANLIESGRAGKAGRVYVRIRRPD